MKETSNQFDALTSAETIDDLKASLSPLLISRLGGGEIGIARAFNLIVSLGVFAPEPASFDKDAFDAVVAVNEETNEPMSPEEAQELLQAAVEAGFIKLKADEASDRYMSHPSLEKIARKFFE